MYLYQTRAGLRQLASGKKIFSRDASGLVREIAPHQAFIYNFMAIGLYTTAWVTLFSIAYSGDFLGANVGLAILFMVAAAIPFYVCTSMLASALPRAGGDYVWQSRILHPAIGFAVTLSAWTIWQWYFASYFGNLVVTLGLQPWLALMGSTGNTSYQNLSTTLGG